MYVVLVGNYKYTMVCEFELYLLNRSHVLCKLQFCRAVTFGGGEGQKLDSDF
jgi:hypothetical protein